MDRRRNLPNFSSAPNNKQTNFTDDPKGVCKAIVESGSTCKESESLKIVDKINELYADRLHRLDEEGGGDCTQLKIKTLESWVNDLGEQNAMLVRTVEQLEQEAAHRVALLEENLQRSSRIALEYMGKLKDYDKQMQEMISKLATASLNEETLIKRVENLQNDITCLIMLIKRAREFGNWEINDLVFKEVTPEDIFGSVPLNQPIDKDPSVEKMRAENEELQKEYNKMESNFKEAVKSIKELEEKIKQCQADVDRKDTVINEYVQKMKELKEKMKQCQGDADQKDAMINEYVQKMKELKEKIIQKSEQKVGYDVGAETEPFSAVELRVHQLELEKWKEKVRSLELENSRARSDLHRLQGDTFDQQAEVDKLNLQLQETERKLRETQKERDELRQETVSLSKLLEMKITELTTLSSSLADSEKYAKDMREALTAEVAEKHDQLLALRRDVQQLEDRCRQADMQTHFKDDIIKEMRKDIKMARSQLAILEGFVKEKGYSKEVGQRLKTLNELSYSLPNKYSSGAPSQDQPNSHFKRFTQSLPYTSVRDSTKLSHMPEQYADKSPDRHSGMEKSRQLSKSWHHPVSQERPTRPRAKNVRTQGQRLHVEILKQMNDEHRKLHQQPEPLCEVEVMESTVSSRTIAVQYYHPKPQMLSMGLLKMMEAKEKQVLEIAEELKKTHDDLQDSWTRTRFVKHDNEEYEAIKDELDSMVEVLHERNSKIEHQNHLLKEMQQRIEDSWEGVTKQNERAMSYLNQMTTAQMQQRQSQAKLQQLLEAQSEGRLVSLSESISTDLGVHEKNQRVDALKSEIDGLHSILNSALGDVKRANEATRTFLEEKERLESSQKNYELRLLALTKKLHMAQERGPDTAEEGEQTEQMRELDRQVELMKRSQRLTNDLLDVIRVLLKMLRDTSKVDGEPSVELLYTREGAIDLTKTSSSATVTPDHHQREIRGLQKQLTDSQKEVTMLKNQLEEFSTPPPAIVFAKEVEEYRVRTVEAQAALEDMKDEMDSLHRNLQIRETQVADFENMIKTLQDTLLNVKMEITSLQEKKNHELMQHNLNSIQVEESCSCNVEMAGGDAVLDKQDPFVRMESSLSKACQEIGCILSKAQSYLKEKEALETSRFNCELKIEKLQLELENTQESLRDTVTSIHDAVACY